LGGKTQQNFLTVPEAEKKPRMDALQDGLLAACALLTPQLRALPHAASMPQSRAYVMEICGGMRISRLLPNP